MSIEFPISFNAEGANKVTHCGTDATCMSQKFFQIFRDKYCYITVPVVGVSKLATKILLEHQKKANKIALY